MNWSVSRNTALLLASNGSGALLSFVLTVVIGRTTGEGGLGIYAAALAWIFPLSMIAEFGVGTLMTRELARSPEVEDAYIKAAMLFRLALGGALVTGLMLVAPLLSQHAAVVTGLQVSAPLILIAPLFSSFSAVFRARQKMWPIPVLNVGMLAAQVGLTMVALQSGAGVLGALVVNTITSTGQLVAAWWLFRTRFRQPVQQSRAPLIIPIHRLIRDAWPFALAALLATLQVRAGFVLLERLSTTEQVGYFTAAQRMADAARVLPSAYFGAVFPMLAIARTNDREANTMLRRMVVGLALFGIATGIFIQFAGEPLIGLIFGSRFAPAAQPLELTFWTLVPGLCRSGLSLYWYARGQEQLANRAMVTALAVLIVIGLILIPRQGAAGAALAGLLAECAALALVARPLLTQLPTGKVPSTTTE